MAPLRNGELAISWKIRSARKRLTPLFQFRIQVIYLRTLGKLLAVVFNTCNCYLILKCGYIFKKKTKQKRVPILSFFHKNKTDFSFTRHFCRLAGSLPL